MGTTGGGLVVKRRNTINFHHQSNNSLHLHFQKIGLREVALNQQSSSLCHQIVVIFNTTVTRVLGYLCPSTTKLTGEVSPSCVRLWPFQTKCEKSAVNFYLPQLPLPYLLSCWHCPLVCVGPFSLFEAWNRKKVSHLEKEEKRSNRKKRPGKPFKWMPEKNLFYKVRARY